MTEDNVTSTTAHALVKKVSTATTASLKTALMIALVKAFAIKKKANASAKTAGKAPIAHLKLVRINAPGKDSASKALAYVRMAFTAMTAQKKIVQITATITAIVQTALASVMTALQANSANIDHAKTNALLKANAGLTVLVTVIKALLVTTVQSLSVLMIAMAGGNASTENVNAPHNTPELTALKSLAPSTATAVECANQEFATAKMASSAKPVKLKAA